MSVINKMLHDLEKRRSQETRQMPVIDTMMMGQTGMTGTKVLFAAAAVVLLAGVVWAVLFLLPTLSAEKTSARQPVAEQVASPPPAEQQPKVTISPMTVEEDVKDSEAKYSLVMDFMQEIQPAEPIETRPSIVMPEKTGVVPEKTGDAANRLTMAATEPGEGDAVGQRQRNEIVLAKKKRMPSRDKRSYQTGLEQLRSGRLQAAVESFTKALAINPAHPEARLQLIATLQQLRQPEEAAGHMRQGLAILPENRALRKEYARYLLHDKQYDKAIDLLRQSPVPSIAGDVEYHALLAALLREAGQFSASARVYARLLQIRPKNGIWWLGLAVSMDQSGNFKQARKAYRRALNLQDLDSGTLEYIKNRLEVL